MKYRIKGLKRQLRINKIESNDTGTYHCISLVDQHVRTTAKLWGEYCLDIESIASSLSFSLSLQFGQM